MKLKYCRDYNEMSCQSSEELHSNFISGKVKSLCIASGNSPLGLYQNFVASVEENPVQLKDLKIVKLDEWGGIDPEDKSSGEYYLRKNIIEPFKIKEENYISFQTNPNSPQQECDRIQKELEKLGPIDVCILGLGMNGHLGFNEPSKELNPFCHVAKLTQKTMQHSMALAMQKKPAYGMTLGMANILKSKKIILVISGADKQKAFQFLLQEKVSTFLPASFLWLHPNTSCYINEENLR